jgi:hypothetical protein
MSGPPCEDCLVVTNRLIGSICLAPWRNAAERSAAQVLVHRLVRLTWRLGGVGIAFVEDEAPAR